jgi:hypothetical protein
MTKLTTGNLFRITAVLAFTFLYVSAAGPAIAQQAEETIRFHTAGHFVTENYGPAATAAEGSDGRTVNPGGALLRSFVLPGWGQYYVNRNDWRRGQYHLGADLALLGSWVYLRTNANMLQGNMYSHAQAYAGINLRTVPRNIEIAVGSNNSLESYNDTQLRTRNWDRLIPDLPENQWQWESEDRRAQYLRMRDRRDRAEQQIPAIATLMVVNRVVSGVHAFISARNQNTVLEHTSLRFDLPESGEGGFVTTLQFRF